MGEKKRNGSSTEGDFAPNTALAFRLALGEASQSHLSRWDGKIARKFNDDADVEKRDKEEEKKKYRERKGREAAGRRVGEERRRERKEDERSGERGL